MGVARSGQEKILYTNNIDFAFPETTQYFFKVFFFLSWGAPPKA